MKSRMMLSTAKLRLREVRGGDLRIHFLHQLQKVAQGGLQRLQEACPRVHPHHRMYQGAQGALRPRWLWIHSGRGGLLSQAADYCPGRPQGDLFPRAQRTCKHVTKLVPKLSPVEECVDVPKEVCTRSRTNPRPVKKPVVKKWCYVPSEESGLA